MTPDENERHRPAAKSPDIIPSPDQRDGEGNPFALFSEWGEEPDEQAYSEL
jgi:hypothetical protein